MRGSTKILLLSLVMALGNPTDGWAQTLEEAARQAAQQHNAKVLSARTVQQGRQRVHVIKLLTKDGVVKTVRLPVREN